jgi:hypothetical protein
LILGCDDEIQLDTMNVYVDPSLSPTDITTEIQEAIDNSVMLNKKLVLDQATYIINSTIWIPSDADIDFGGSTIKRESGMQVEMLGPIFDMIVNINFDTVGNENITLKNLIIDGNTLGNGNIHNDDHRFSGLKLSRVRDSRLENITVINTINAEHRYDKTKPNNTDGHPAGGIFFYKSDSISCYGLHAYNNKLTGIVIRESQKIKIDGSITKDNEGTGIGTIDADSCEFKNIRSYNNGFQTWISGNTFSNISINGENCLVKNVKTYDCASGSGLIIGHDGDISNADYTVVDSVESYHNAGDGITVRNSTDVKLSRIWSHNNQGSNLRLNETTHDANIVDAHLYGYYDTLGITKGGYGLRIEGGGGHTIGDGDGDTSKIYDNFHQGIGILDSASFITVKEDVHIFNNGRADEFTDNPPTSYGIPGHISSGILLKNSDDCFIHCPYIYCSDDDINIDTTINKSQDYGIEIHGGSNHTIYAKFDPDSSNNLQPIYQHDNPNDPTNVTIDTTACN